MSKSLILLFCSSFLALALSACGSGTSGYTPESAKSATTSDLLSAHRAIIKKEESILKTLWTNHLDEKSQRAKDLVAKAEHLDQQDGIIKKELGHRGIFSHNIKMSELK